MYKKQLLERLARVPDDEPVFLLRAQDLLADQTVKQWAYDARAAGVNKDKVTQALDCANLMSLWLTRKIPD
jgi:hypothetical protein